VCRFTPDALALPAGTDWFTGKFGTKPDETPIDTIRRYLSAGFFKDHLKTYKSRPIYWLFSSGDEKAFEAFVYLHRYNQGTLSRMRMSIIIGGSSSG
jgi:type II restriction/modification system DNA methylase subunit YeeA